MEKGEPRGPRAPAAAAPAGVGVTAGAGIAGRKVEPRRQLKPRENHGSSEVRKQNVNHVGVKQTRNNHGVIAHTDKRKLRPRSESKKRP
jgi:hypothetical protein